LITICIVVSVQSYIMHSVESSLPSANLIQKTLRLTGYNSGIGPLRPARSEDSTVLQDFSNRIARGEADANNILYTTGYGIHRSYEFPVRSPALMLPVLHVLEEMKRIGLQPASYIIYQATDFIAATNGLDPEKARASSRRLENYLRGYVERYHSAVAEHVSFEFGSEYTENISRSIENLASQIRSKTQQLIRTAGTMNKTKEYEQKHSNSAGQADIYTAANALYSGVNEDYPFREKVSEKTELIIPVGGKAEKPFFEITSMLADMRMTERKVTPFLTPIGARATYYPARESGDPMTVEQFAKAATMPVADGPIRMDIKAMVADGATEEGLREIFSSLK
jgi:hypothetical protein